MRVVDEARRGITYARSRGFDEATGELIARIDADTIPAPTWAATIRDEFASDPSLGAIGGGAAIAELSPDGRFWFQVHYRLFRAWHERSIGVRPMLYGFNNAMRRSAWAAARPAHRARRRECERRCRCDDRAAALGSELRFVPRLKVKARLFRSLDPGSSRATTAPTTSRSPAMATATRSGGLVSAAESVGPNPPLEPVEPVAQPIPPKLRDPDRPRKPWYRSFRVWLTIATAVVVLVILWAARGDVTDAYHSLSQVDPWILLLLIPAQLGSYWTTGEVLFSYLRGRGDLRRASPFAIMRLSLEFNFTNHMLPSSGAAGMAYASWKLARFGVPASRSTIGQLARFAVTFASFTLLLFVAILVLAFTGNATPEIIWPAIILAVVAVVVTVGGATLLRSKRALHWGARVIAKVGNAVARPFVHREVISLDALLTFFDGAHAEIGEILKAPRLLLRPFLWSFAVNVFDSSMYLIGLARVRLCRESPRSSFVAYGLATVVSIVAVTPNGTGAYEVALIWYLTSGGVPPGLGVAAIILTRVILMAFTILFGWAFYQHSISSAGRPPRR